jgi:hypothetical protein
VQLNFRSNTDRRNRNRGDALFRLDSLAVSGWKVRRSGDWDFLTYAGFRPERPSRSPITPPRVAMRTLADVLSTAVADRGQPYFAASAVFAGRRVLIPLRCSVSPRSVSARLRVFLNAGYPRIASRKEYCRPPPDQCKGSFMFFNQALLVF